MPLEFTGIFFAPCALACSQFSRLVFPSCRPFAFYALSQAKIRDFNAVKSWAPYYEKILYEDILEGDGLRAWLKSLETL